MLLNKRITRTFLSLILCLFLSTNLCFAATKISKKDIPNYQTDMGKALEKIVNGKNTLNNKTYKDYMNDLYQQDFTWYKTVYLPDKNQMKRNADYVDIIMAHSGALQSLSECFWQDIEPVIIKYNLKMDERYNYFDYLYQYYLKPYNIDLADEFMTLVKSVQPNQYKLLELRTEIVNYSRAYEEKKAENFYNKFVVPKIPSVSSVNLADDWLWKNNKFRTDLIYNSRPRIVQIFSDSFLADCSYDAYDAGYKTFLVKDKDSYKLDINDNFVPILPLKFTGQYYSYTTILGQRKRVPIFTVYIAKAISLPKITENFYFATKPNFNDDLTSNSDIYIGPITLFNSSWKFAPMNMERVWKN